MLSNKVKSRISLIAVSSLTLGLFSIVGTPSANAAVTIADKFSVAIDNSSTGVNVVTAGGGDTTLDKSLGFLAVTSAASANQEAVAATAVTVKAGVTGTATMLASGKLVMGVTGGAITDRVAISCVNGTLSGRSSATIASSIVQIATNVLEVTSTGHGLLVGDRVTVDSTTAGFDQATAQAIIAVTANTFTIAKTGANAGPTTEAGVITLAESDPFNASSSAVFRSNGANPSLAAIATPNPGATSMTCSAWKGASVTAATPTVGTLIGQWVISLTSTALTGSFSATDSAVAVTTTATAAIITTSVDASTSGILAGNPLFIQVVGKNAYGQALASGTFVATATNGATIAWGGLAVGGTGAATAAGTLSVATLTASGDGADQVRIDPASSLTTTTTTVTITHNGTPVTTKTLTFYGEAKKIVIESVKSGRTGTTVAASDATAYAVYSYRDSADGKVPGGAAGFAALSATSIISTGASVRSPSRSTQATLVGTNSALGDATETAIGTGTDGVFAFSCGSTSGTSTVVIAAANTISLATLTANVTIACNGGFATYTVSTDKASYAVGEIATITIDAKDSSGNAVSENTALPVASVSVGGGALTAAIAGTELFTAGKRTVQAQMTTAGTFNLVVTIAGSVTSTATARYAITDGAVSNAAVLQSIVALIASINKQIAALQKLILARR